MRQLPSVLRDNHVFEPRHWQCGVYRTPPRTDAEIIIMQEKHKCKTDSDTNLLEKGFDLSVALVYT